MYCAVSYTHLSVAIRDIVIRALFVSHTKQIAGIASSLKSDLKAESLMNYELSFTGQLLGGDVYKRQDIRNTWA